MMQQYGHQNVVVIDATFGTNENKVNSLTVTYVVELKNLLKHNETRLLYVDTYWKSVMFIVISIVHIDGVLQVEERLSSCVHNHILE
jgi:hypothetical protein